MHTLVQLRGIHCKSQAIEQTFLPSKGRGHRAVHFSHSSMQRFFFHFLHFLHFLCIFAFCPLRVLCTHSCSHCISSVHFETHFFCFFFRQPTGSPGRSAAAGGSKSPSDRAARRLADRSTSRSRGPGEAEWPCRGCIGCASNACLAQLALIPGTTRVIKMEIPWKIGNGFKSPNRPGRAG